MLKSIRLFSMIALVVTVAAFSAAQTAVPAKEAPKPALSPSSEVLAAWNDIGGRLVDMAEDFPEEKYDFKTTPAQRTFADNLLHVASDYRREISAVQGSQTGPPPDKDFSRADYKTKADIVKLLKQAVADGAALIQAQGDAGLARENKSPYDSTMQHVSYTWLGTLEHAGEHYGQLVVYYRVAGLVPPASRPKK